MIVRFIAFLSLLLGLLAATSAHAANGYTTGNVNMRAGPGVSYARIVVIPVRSAVAIENCTQAARWCLVRWRGYRGWVSGRYLRFSQPRSRIIAPPPYVIFDFGYRSRVWRGRHDRWHGVRPLPKKKKRVIRRNWNRDHDRWHQKNTRRPRRNLPKFRMQTDNRNKRSDGRNRKRICPPNRPNCN